MEFNWLLGRPKSPRRGRRYETFMLYSRDRSFSVEMYVIKLWGEGGGSGWENTSKHSYDTVAFSWVGGVPFQGPSCNLHRLIEQATGEKKRKVPCSSMLPILILPQKGGGPVTPTGLQIFYGSIVNSLPLTADSVDYRTYIMRCMRP